jgi:formylglycine-generating enzyme required for sulfatase activity
MSPEKQRRTFLSYSRINKDFALKLAKELKSAGFLVWLDQLDIPTGARWDNELEKALEECEIFMLILTPAAIASENVKDEIGYAIDNSKRILPILLENCNVPLRLRRFQYVDFTTMSYDEGVKSAKQLLTNLINEVTVPRGKIQAGPQDKESQAKVENIAEQKAKSDQFESERETVIKASALLAQGKQLFQYKDWSGAAQIFRQVLTLIPNHAETMKLLSNVEAQIQQEREALARKIEEPDTEDRPSQPEVQPAEEMAAPPPKRFSRKTIIFGAVGSLLALTGIIGASIFLTGNRPSPITSVGMVNIPAGSYPISTDSNIEVADFWIDRYEITNNDYAKFIDDTQNDPPRYWVDGQIPSGQRNHPVSQIVWDQAEEYCSWAGKRLPTEAEWEIAARGPFGWKYPWGNNPDSVKQETKGTRPVDSNPANLSYFGAYYMSGNVWEWVKDPYTSTAKNEHVMRGGAYGPLDVLTTAISVPDNSSANEKAGFRCAASGEDVTRVYDEALALDDNFESTNTNWPGIHEDNFLFDYHELGFYHLEARESDKFIPAFYDHGTYSNFVMETGVFIDEANTENQQGNFLYGLGVQTTQDQFYAFVISANDQNWQVLKGTLNPGAVIGDASDLTVIKSGTEGSIRGVSEEREDRLTVIANGTEFLYYVNGNLLYKVTAEDHQKGKVGFIVETLDNVTRVHIHFNWVKLQNIESFDS